MKHMYSEYQVNLRLHFLTTFFSILPMAFYPTLNEEKLKFFKYT